MHYNRQAPEIIADSVLRAGAELGEAALWHPFEQKLYWVDVEGQALHIFDPITGNDVILPTGSRIGTVVPLEGANVLVALQKGIFEMDTITGALTFITNPLKSPDCRFNDGKCDPAGRFWVGTKCGDGRTPEALLYRMDGDRSIHQMLDYVFISNGITWSLDKTTMYYIDTPTRSVQAFDYDNNSGSIKNGRIIVRIPENAGFPDGMTIDIEGNLWIALWGGFAVVKYNPESGQHLLSVKVEAPNVSSCAFGGKNLDILYITTARSELSTEDLKRFPLSGNVFAVKPGVAGLRPNFFKKARQ